MQAVLILAHRDFDEVLNLSKLLQKRFQVYIHFDTKMELTEQNQQALENHSIKYVQEIEVNWGGWGISAATIILMRMAMENPDIEYIHVISGQDWLGRNVDEIYEFYKNKSTIFMEYYPAKGIKKTGEPIIWWQKYYYNYDTINRRTTFGKIYHRIIIMAQTLFRVNKFKKYNIDIDIYHGANWMDLPRYAVEYLLEYYDEHENIRKVFQTGYCADEFWVQTILCNSKYISNIDKNNHRYVNWEWRYGSHPAILDERDFDDIVKGEYHFIRKVDASHSAELKEKLSQHYCI